MKKLDGARIKSLQGDLSKGWKIIGRRLLEKEFKFKDFLGALAFTNQVGKQAEKQQHHPDVYLGWGKVKLTLSTHDIGGLSEADFLLASRIDRISQKS
jgi:4a-hydroxytetrahydrobiopterin dehydratase